MTDRDTHTGLRAARTAHGWSQADAARELAALARNRGVPVAAAASLKTLLSRWENGHTLPDPQYRSLLADLFGRSVAELGLAGPEPPPDAGGGLLASLSAAAAVQRGNGMSLWRQQLALAHRIDDELGAAGAGELVRAQVERLAATLVHTVPAAARAELAQLLAGAATLAGAQALDRTRHDLAWRLFDQARSAAREAERPGDEAAAVAGQVAVLVDIGESGTALQMLGQTPAVPDDAAQAQLDGALAMAAAAAGDRACSRQAIAAAERRLRRSRLDRVDRPDGPPVELADLHRWHGRALVTLGDEGAVQPLRQALQAGPRSARHRAAVHADLALSLQIRLPDEAAAHAMTARRVAAGIGSERIPARLAALGDGP